MFDDARVDVGSPAHGRSVAQVFRDLLDDPSDRAPPAADRAARHRRDRQPHGGEHGRVPGAEILGADLQAGQLLEMIVHVGAVQLVPPSALVVGEQRIAARGPGLERADHLADLRVGDRLDAFITALGGIAEHDLTVREADVLPPQRGQAIGSVVLGVSLAAHPEEAEVEQPHSGREHPLPGQAASGQLRDDDLAGVGQRGGEIEHVIVLLLVPPFPPARMVEILPAPGRIEPDGLDVPVRPRADPHVLPGGRDHEILDAG